MKLRTIITNIPELVSGYAFCIMLVVVFLNVVLRYLFNYSLVLMEEVAAISFLYAIFVGAAACYRRKALIGIDIFVDNLPASVKKTTQMSVDCFMIFANVVLLYLSLKFAVSAWAKKSLSLGIPFTFFNLSATIGFAFMTYYSVKHFIWNIQGKKFINPDEDVRE